MERLTQRAVISAFQNQIDKNIVEPNVQLKTILRRMNERDPQEDERIPTAEKVLQELSQGVEVLINGDEYVAVLESIEDKPSGGLIKQLSREIDKRTRSPK